MSKAKEFIETYDEDHDSPRYIVSHELFRKLVDMHFNILSIRDREYQKMAGEGNHIIYGRGISVDDLKEMSKKHPNQVKPVDWKDLPK